MKKASLFLAVLTAGLVGCSGGQETAAAPEVKDVGVGSSAPQTASQTPSATAPPVSPE